VNLHPAQEINDPVEDKKRAKIGQFGERFLRVFVDFELKMRFSPPPEPGALTGLSHTPN
jgi:hypothetical protein